MIKKYRVHVPVAEIRIVDVESETENEVILLFNKRHERKITGDGGYFDTLKDAKEFLCSKINQEIDKYNFQIRVRTEALNRVQNITESKLVNIKKMYSRTHN